MDEETKEGEVHPRGGAADTNHMLTRFLSPKAPTKKRPPCSAAIVVVLSTTGSEWRTGLPISCQATASRAIWRRLCTISRLRLNAQM